MIHEHRFEGATHRAELGNHSLFITADSYDDACRKLIELNGGGVPQISPVADEPETTADRSAADQTVVVQNPLTGRDEEGSISAEGKERSESDAKAMVDAGFAPEQPLYARGTRVNEWGVANAKSKRAEWEAMPRIDVACMDLEDQVAEERRRVIGVPLAGARFDSAGGLALPGSKGPGMGRRYQLNIPAFKSLVSRMGLSGSRYLVDDCSPKLRAINMNHHLSAADEEEELRLLVRRNPNARGKHEVFGVVGQRYQEQFNAGVVAEAVRRVMGETDARGTVVYDGRRTKIQALFHSTVRPEEYVAGEFFRAGIQVRTDDTGGGSCIVDAVVWQNLCLNLIIIDRAVSRIDNIIHVGDLEKLVERLDEAMRRANESIGHFVKAWGQATRDDVVGEALRFVHDAAAKRELEAAQSGAIAIEDVIPGFFSAMKQRDLVPLKRNDVRRDAETKRLIAPELVDAFRTDLSSARVATKLSRAALVNAITRHAHTTAPGTFGEDDLEEAAGRLLFGTDGNQPPPLPYQAVGLSL